MDGDDGDVVIRTKPTAERSISTISNGTALELSVTDHPVLERDSAEPETRRPPRTKEEIELSNLKKKTRKRTRRFEVDGVVVTTTTSKVTEHFIYLFWLFWVMVTVSLIRV